MRLRSRLLLLITLLVSTALAASFAFIFRAVRAQALADLDGSLESAHSVWESLSRAQAQNLAATVQGKSADAGFVSVLRGTDRATLLDELLETRQNNPVLDLVAVYDEQGKLKVATEPTLESNPADPLIAAALDEQVGASFWHCSSGTYLAAVSPILKQGGVEGVLLLASRIDGEYVESLARDTHVQVAALPLQGTGYTTAQKLLGGEVRKRTYPLPDFAGNSLGSLVIGRDLNAALGYMRGVAGQLLWLGGATVGLAFLVSIPLVGRMTQAVVLLEKTQAEMDAVFQANADGLVALDQAGRIANANPAAAVCLGLALEALPGRLLQELLPEAVFSQLVAAAPSDGQLVQRCHWQREGRTYQLTRTFVASRHAEVGSVLVTRELSGGETPRNPLEMLEAPPEDFEKTRKNLLWLSGRRYHSPPARWREMLAEFGLPAEGGTEPQVELESEQLRLLLLNLMPADGLAVREEGGGYWLTTRKTLGVWEREVVKSLAQEIQGRVAEEGDDLHIWLPRAL